MTHGIETPVCVKTRDPQELESVLSANLRSTSIKPRQGECQGFQFQHLKLGGSHISLLQGDGAMDVRLNPDMDKPASYIFWMQIDGSCCMNPDGCCLATKTDPGFAFNCEPPR